MTRTIPASERLGPSAGARALSLLFFSWCLGACCFGADEASPPTPPTAAPSVTMPITLEALDAYARAQGGIARVETVHEHGSGSASCGHSLLCILVLPAVFVAPFIPRDHQLATIERDGVAIYQGRFETNGAFIQARVREGELYTDAERLRLSALGRDFVVLTYRTRVGAPEGERTRVPLRDQIDLVPLYREALSSAASPDALVDEAIDVLGADMAPLLVEHLERGARPLAYADGRIAAACEHAPPSGDTSFVDAFRAPGPLRDRLVQAVRDRGDDVAIDPVLACLEPSTAPSAALEPFVRAIVRRGCAHGFQRGRALAQRLADTPELLAAARDETEHGCDDPGYRLALGGSVPAEAIAPLLASPDRAPIARALDPAVEAQRAALFTALSADVGATAHRLVAARVAPTRDELGQVLRALAAPGLLASRGEVDLLRLFAAASVEDRRAALASAPAPRPERALLLALLGGERTRLVEIARGIDARAATSFALVPTAPEGDDEHDVAFLDADDAHVPLFGLWLAGCPAQVLRETPSAGWPDACTGEIAPRWELTLAPATTSP